MSDEKLAGANYIITFYQEVQALTQTFAQYLNLVTELKLKYGKETDDNDEKLPDEEKQTYERAIQLLRYSAIKTNVYYKAIIAATNITEDKEATKAYKELFEQEKEIALQKEKLETYVIQMNKVLLSNVIKDLLKSSQDLASAIYSNSNGS